jgi:hypothetical protein
VLQAFSQSEEAFLQHLPSSFPQQAFS